MPVLAWKCLYPVGIHFVLSQLVSYLGLYFLVQRTGADMSAYYQHVLMLTGLTGILAAVPCILLYRGDFSRRKETGILYPAADRHLPVPEILGFLIIGAFLGQYGNILVGLFQQYLNPEAYQETQSLISEGKSIWSLIFWMGIAAPFAEEVIFRWLVFLRMRDNMRVITAHVFRIDIWNLPYESAPGSVCNYYGIAFRIAPGMERKSVCQCVSSYGGKYLEPAGQ